MISKSDYMLALKQPAWLWLKTHNPEKIPPADTAIQARRDAGHAFEPYVESLFPDGITLGFGSPDEYRSLADRTRQTIGARARVLFQPRFDWGEFFCISDIVSIVGQDVVDLYEIKATTRTKTEHLYDLAFQKTVIEGNGLAVRNVAVAHANNKYVRRGPIDPREFVEFDDVTEKVSQLACSTPNYMREALEAVRSDTMPDPNPMLAKLGSKAEWLKVYEHMFPPEVKVWPDDVTPNINREAITKFMSGLTYPLYFLDYETMSAVVPYFDGHRPCQQVPMQYSLHILRTPDGELEHKEFLHRENSDPARPLTEQLIEDMGTEGSVVVWFENFEKTRNRELGEMLPDHKDAMQALNDRVVDLMTPFQQKWYDDPRFEGSASIKKVLPVVCPELSYKILGIQEGGSAQHLWMEAILDGTRETDKERITGDLLEYCELDTRAMVEIYRVLKRLIV